MRKILWWAGVALLIFTVHTNWSSPLAAWLFAIPLLRFARLSPVRSGLLKVWGAQLLAMVVWLAATSLLFVPSGVLAFTLLSLLLTLPIAADRLLADRGFWSTLAFPAVLVSAEYLFQLLIGFGDFGALGSTQHENLPLLQVASITGVYGISFLVGWLASIVNWAWAREWRDVRIALVYPAVLALVLIGGAARLVFFAPATETVRVATVSPTHAADQRTSDALEAADLKYWRSAEMFAADPVVVRGALAPVTDDLLESTRRQATAGAKIVLWPETHARVLEQDVPALIARTSTVARETGAYVNLAYSMFTGTAPNVRNISTLVTPAGEVAWTYDKAHPTPMEPMTPGPGVVPVADSPYGRLGGVICYDADYSALMRQAADKDAALMLVPANDWAEFSELHAEKAVMRSVEYGYSMLRNSSHGLATAVDAQGRVLGSADWFRTDQNVLVTNLPIQPRVSTVYSSIGDVFAWLCLAGAAGFGAVLLRSRLSR